MNKENAAVNQKEEVYGADILLAYSFSEENDKQVQMSPLSTPPDTKVSQSHFLNSPSTLLYKKK